ncbi:MULTISPECIES: DUF6541 family protein [unclassified Mycobacterium]|uniref:DUF6541 family protein n=1 Tax=unclassified Mycobacterium TaxID=2642494 RepID=UPI0029C995DC|nr:MULTISPECIES: DUF6541 family protein [unclassified Mycobacterium]
MSLTAAVLLAVILLVAPGTVVGCAARLPVPVAVAVAPALTYGVVGAAIVPFGAVGIPWNAWTALMALAGVAGGAVGCRAALARYRDHHAEVLAVAAGPAFVVGAGVLIGAVLIGYAAVSGMPHWQSIPSTWDSVWHANTIRYILDTGQASSNHMGELRNVETHAVLYYPSAFHALAAVFSQLTAAAPATAFTVSALAAAIWLFPASAAILAWHLMRSRTTQWCAAGCAAAAAALSASFTAVPYVTFYTAAIPNLVGNGIAIPAMVLTASTLGHRDRIPIAILAVVGTFSVHTSGGVVTLVFLAAWWLLDAVWHPVRGRVADIVTLLAATVPAGLILAPQFIALLQQANIIAGHQFHTGLGRKRSLINAVLQHTRHLNDFPIQNIVIGLAGVGALILLVKKIWWPLAVWLLLVVAIVHSAAPFGGPIGLLTGKFSDLFYSDPRRLSAVVTMVLAPMAGIALFTVAATLVSAVRRAVARIASRSRTSDPAWLAATAVLVVAVSVGCAWHYFPRHRLLFGQKYDSVMIDHRDVAAMAYLATLPGAHSTLIGNANTDGTAWMYAIADLHPLWTHYDYPVQQGPGYNRFIIWAYADDADTDPRVAAAVKALNIRYVLTSAPVVSGFVMPDGLVSLDRSKSWTKIYDNGETRIFEWRADRQQVG